MGGRQKWGRWRSELREVRGDLSWGEGRRALRQTSEVIYAGAEGNPGGILNASQPTLTGDVKRVQSFRIRVLR